MASKRTAGAMSPLSSFLRDNRGQMGIGTGIGVVILISAIMIGALILVKLGSAVPKSDLGEQVTNETVQLQTDVFTYQLAHYPIINGTVRVYNSTTTFTEGTDYRIYYSNGTLETLSGGALYNTTQVISVDYKYEGQTYQNFQDVKDTGFSALTMLALAGFVGAAIVILALLMNLIGRRRGGGGF